MGNETIRFFYVLRKPKGISDQESKEIDQYLDISFLQFEEDWYSTDQVYTEVNYGAKKCQPDDFGHDN